MYSEDMNVLLCNSLETMTQMKRSVKKSWGCVWMGTFVSNGLTSTTVKLFSVARSLFSFLGRTQQTID